MTRSLLTFQGTHPLVLDLFLVQNLGHEYYLWEPETVWTEAIRAAQAPNISEVNKHKVQAVRTIHMADTSFKRWEVFEKVIAALNGVVPRFDVMQKPDLGQLMFGFDTMLQIRSEKLSDEVCRYIAACLLTDGVAYAPRPLQGCNKHLGQHPLHKEVRAAIKKGSDSEAIQIQLGKMEEGRLYKVAGSKRLLDQMRVLRAN